MTELTYIDISDTVRIEITALGNFYPQRLIIPAWRDSGEGWAYDGVGKSARKFKSEKGARAFITNNWQKEN